MNVVISDTAKTKLNGYRDDADHFLRISVVPGGCSGMTYNAAIDSNMMGQDEVIFEDGDIKIVADMRSSLFLDGLHIDFSNDLIQSGFRISNPNASESCACGSSFAT